MIESTVALPRLVLRDDDVLARRLREGQRLLQSSPELACAIAQACVAEGRRFARTPEGARWKDTLSRSELMQRGRLIWQAYGLDALANGEPELDWLGLLVAQFASADLEALLAALTEAGD
jgi:hypothetical protein